MEEIVVDLMNKMLTTQEQDKHKYFIIFIVLACLFIISVASNILSQWLINKQLFRNETKKIKIEKKLIVIEELYKKLTYLKNETYSTPLKNQFIENVKNTNNWIAENKINLTTELFNSSQEILDYFSEIYTNYERKDIKKEKKLFEKFLSGYDKL